jgi:hypothetical protein
LLSRDLPSTCPHAEHRWLVYAAGIFSTRPGALSSSRRTSRPQPDREIPRFSPALARTFRPGFSVVPLADRVMFAIFRPSTRITSKRRAMSVDVFSHQSFRRSVSLAFSRAMAVLTLPRRADPRLARASLRWRRPYPASLRHSDLTPVPIQSPHIPLPTTPPCNAEPLIPPGLPP